MTRSQEGSAARGGFPRRRRARAAAAAAFPRTGAGVAAALRAASPLRLFVLTLASVCVGEILVMALLSASGSASLVVNAVFDGLFVTFLVAPVLFWFLVRPLSERVGELSALRTELEESREAYRSLVDSTVDSIYLVDGEGRYRFVNRHHAARLGVPVEKLLGGRYADFHEPERSAEFARVVGQVVREGRPVCQEHRSPRDERWFLRTFTPVADRAGRTVAVTVVSKDITGLKRLERKLQQLSTTDELTGLMNRRGFEGLAGHRLKLAQREGADATVLFADLDGLKRINDAHGHLAGDEAIRGAARVLAGVARETDIVARIGGDEFVMLLAGSAGADQVIERIREGLGRHNAASPGGAPLSLSIGTAVCPAGSPRPVDELIADADAAMYEAKLRARAAGSPGAAV